MLEGGTAIAFWVLAALTLGSALGVVHRRNLFHAVLFLVLSFGGVAGLYVTLSADFLAAVQVLIYAGAIAVLMLFAILLTRNSRQGNPPSHLSRPALITALVFGIGVIWIQIFLSQWPLATQSPAETTTEGIADALFGPFLLPFEVASVLLLAAMVGAIILARD